MKISIIGYMGSGKSTVGKELAKQLGISWLDTDEILSSEEKMSISEVFKTKGEIYFRMKEHQILGNILSSDSDFVLSTGGGTPCYYHNMELLNEFTYTVYLRLNPNQIKNRLTNETEKRPLIAHLSDENLTEFISKHLFERKNFYEKAKLTIDANEKPVEEILHEINLHLPRP